MKFKDKKTKFYIAGAILGFVIVVGSVVSLTGYNPFAGDETPPPPPPTPLGASTFELYSGVDGEVVSNFATMDIWVPKSGATFDEGYEDITALVKNFEREESGKDADDISIDLSDYDYVWAEITGNSVWENNFHLIHPGGRNTEYRYYVHHMSSAVPFNIIFKNSGDAITIAGEQTNGNFTGVFDAPIDTSDAATRHYGDAWALSTTEYGELTLKQQKVYWDEGEWQDQYPTYDPTLDTVNEYDRDFETITNTFALKFVMNETISVTDGAATQINVTIAKGFPIDILISGTNLYMVWYDGFDFLNGPYTFDFEMWFGVNITISTVYSGRVDVPGSLSSITNFVAYNTIATAAS